MRVPLLYAVSSIGQNKLWVHQVCVWVGRGLSGWLGVWPWFPGAALVGRGASKASRLQQAFLIAGGDAAKTALHKLNGMFIQSHDKRTFQLLG